MAKKSTRTPMAVDKSNTPAWMRVVVILLAITFGLGGVAVVAAGIGGSAAPADGGAASGDTITSQFQPRVDAALVAVESNPENPDIVIQVGHAYFEWAVALYESGQYPASVPMWLAAVSFYDQTLALDPGNDIALGNKAFALYYAQDESAAEGLRAFIDGAADNADLAQQVENARGMLAEVEASGETTTTP
ncbi:tetratricopeptide repeat protein [Anaerosoma tenue]|uniref:hypothetical protein n=1 Tax=Anaerosoma tenue TaxID=2933588 RepID=UPI002260A748|nr:hypothetical protein [Anaerosoma tenue]MCK8114662.1 hypothetical protein [Anaerosoma tenue]